MGIAHYIKDIGRGKEGARSLNAAQAEDLLSQVLDRQVSDLEIGAFCVAMRIKGETTEELDGFLRAALARCLVLQPPSPAVILPSYNGARKLPNFTPLLAHLLARQGVQVLVHGPRRDPTRGEQRRDLRGDGLEACRLRGGRAGGLGAGAACIPAHRGALPPLGRPAGGATGHRPAQPRPHGGQAAGPDPQARLACGW